MSKRTWIRLAIWIPLVLLALGYRWWLDRSRSAEAGVAGVDVATADSAGWRERSATAAEWNRPIAALGRDRQAKRLAWHALGPEPVRADGALVWWHDGEQERVGYLPAAGEDAGVGLALIVGLLEGSAVLFDLHGDPSLLERLGELSAGDGLPAGWTVLRAPGPAAGAPVGGDAGE